MPDHTEKQIFDQWTGENEKDRSYVGEGLAVDVVEQVIRILEQRGLNQTWLAGQLGVSRQSVSRIFQAAPNMQLQTLAGLAIALEVKPRILVDSENYIIRSIDESLDIEDLKTDQAFQLSQISRRYAESSDSTTFQAITPVESQYATAG